jgi:opacity protein-like surface antigen
MRASKSLIAGLFLLSAAPVLAQPIDADPGWQQPGVAPAPDGGPDGQSGMRGYAGLRGSLAFSGNAITTYTTASPSTQLRTSYAVGGGGSIYYGARLPLNLRLELEGLYRFQPLSTVSLNGVGVGGVSGNTQMAAPMVNLLWDLPVPDDLAIQPFVGMGVGAAWTDTNARGGGNTYVHQNRWDLAYQMLAGLAVPLSDSSRVTAMYRFMKVPDAGHKCATSGTAQSVCLDNGVNSSSVDLGYELDL